MFLAPIHTKLLQQSVLAAHCALTIERMKQDAHPAIVATMVANPRQFGFVWSETEGCWTRTKLGLIEYLHAPPPLPFFLDPEQIADLTPEIDWTRRVGDRVRAFIQMGAERSAYARAQA